MVLFLFSGWLTPLHASAPCVDANGQCDSWASSGQCTENPAYMRLSCRRACGVCFPTNSDDTNGASVEQLLELVRKTLPPKSDGGRDQAFDGHSLAAYVEATAPLLAPFSERAHERLHLVARHLPACLGNRLVFEVRGDEDPQVDLSVHTPASSMLQELLYAADTPCGRLARNLTQSSKVWSSLLDTFAPQWTDASSAQAELIGGLWFEFDVPADANGTHAEAPSAQCSQSGMPTAEGIQSSPVPSVFFELDMRVQDASEPSRLREIASQPGASLADLQEGLASLLQHRFEPLQAPLPRSVARLATAAITSLPAGFVLRQLGFWLARDPSVLRLVLGGPMTPQALRDGLASLVTLGWQGGLSAMAHDSPLARVMALVADYEMHGAMQLSIDATPHGIGERLGIELAFAPTREGVVVQRKLLDLLADFGLLSRAKWRGIYGWVGEEPTAACLAQTARLDGGASGGHARDACRASSGGGDDGDAGGSRAGAREPSVLPNQKGASYFAYLPWRRHQVALPEQQVSVRREISHIKLMLRGSEVTGVKVYLEVQPSSRAEFTGFHVL